MASKLDVIGEEDSNWEESGSGLDWGGFKREKEKERREMRERERWMEDEEYLDEMKRLDLDSDWEESMSRREQGVARDKEKREAIIRDKADRMAREKEEREANIRDKADRMAQEAHQPRARGRKYKKNASVYSSMMIHFASTQSKLG